MQHHLQLNTDSRVMNKKQLTYKFFKNSPHSDARAQAAFLGQQQRIRYARAAATNYKDCLDFV